MMAIAAFGATSNLQLASSIRQDAARIPPLRHKFLKDFLAFQKDSVQRCFTMA
jgi:hypothetical protein